MTDFPTRNPSHLLFSERLAAMICSYCCGILLCGGDDTVRMRCLDRHVPIDELSGLNRDAFVCTQLAKVNTFPLKIGRSHW